MLRKVMVAGIILMVAPAVLLPMAEADIPVPVCYATTVAKRTECENKGYTDCFDADPIGTGGPWICQKP